VEFTVGRHAARDGVDVDPIVAAALRERPTSLAAGTPRHGSTSEPRELTGTDGEGGLGWPDPPHDGTGLGWPVDVAAELAPAGDQPAVALVSSEPRARRRLGWRRIFGGGQSGGRSEPPSDSSAA
jgi:hypothetical protein